MTHPPLAAPLPLPLAAPLPPFPRPRGLLFALMISSRPMSILSAILLRTSASEKKINSAHLSNCTRVPMLHEMATALKRNLFQGYLSDDEQVAQRQNNSTACHRKKEKRSSQLRCRLLSERVASQPNMADIHRHRSEKDDESVAMNNSFVIN